MSLSRFNPSKNTLLSPSKLEKGDLIELLKRKLNARSFAKMCRIFDEQIASINPSASSALTFGMLATLVGRDAVCPTTDANYVWRKADEVAGGDSKLTHLILGAFAQWRFACDSRDWICARKDSNRVNEEGEDIYVTIYWIPPPAPPKFTAADLGKKWSSSERSFR